MDDVMLIHCRCGRWSRAVAGEGGRSRCPACGEDLDVPAGAGFPSPDLAAVARPRRRWKRVVLALLLAPTAGFVAGAASGDWRGVWRIVQARIESERQIRARFEETLAKGRAAEDAGDVRAAVATYRRAAALGEPGSSRRRRADEALNAAAGARAEAHRDRLRTADRARASHDYAAAEAALVQAAAAFEESEPEAVAAAKILEEVRSAAAKRPEYLALLSKGDDLCREKRYEPAVRAYSQAAELFPDEAAPREAIEKARAEREPLAEQLDVWAGDAEAAGDLAKAVEVLTRLVEEVGGKRSEEGRRRLTDARRALAGEFGREGLAALKRGDFQAAADLLGRSIAAGANAPDLLAGKRVADRELVLKRCEEMLIAGRYAEALEAATNADGLGEGDARTAALVVDAGKAIECAEIHRFQAGKGPVRDLAFRSADGRLVIATADGTLQVWGARGGRFDAPAWDRKPAGRKVDAAALSEDGRWAAVASGVSIELIDLDATATPPRLVTAPAAVSALAVGDGRGGEPGLAAGGPNGSVWAWPSATREAEPVVLASPSVRPVTQVRISRGGDLAVGRDSGPVDLYRSREGEYIRLALSDRDASFLRHEVTSLSFSPDGKTLLAGRDTGSIASWSLLSDGRSIIDQPTKREVVDMAFSDDGTLFAAASRDRSIQIGFIRQEAAGPAFQPSTILDLHRDSVHALAFDGSAVLATGGGDGTVKLWSLERGKLAAAVGK